MTKTTLSLGLMTVAIFVGVAPAGGAQHSPFADAVAVWHMADSRDSAGKADRLTVRGEVKLGVVLEGRERDESLRQFTH